MSGRATIIVTVEYFDDHVETGRRVADTLAAVIRGDVQLIRALVQATGDLGRIRSIDVEVSEE